MPSTLVTPDAVAELLTRGEERGYLLASELEDVRDPFGEPFEIPDSVLVVDDLSAPEDSEEAAERLRPDVMSASRDPVRAYLDAAGRTPLLDAEQEQDLAKRYQAGLAARKMGQRPGPTPAARARLQAIARDGERAKEHLVRANLRLVVPQAKKWAGRDMDLAELIQEGNLGLIRAVEKFDHTKGYKFSTYAVWWIRQALQRGVASKARTVRVPSTYWEEASKARKVEAKLRQALGRDPTDEEVASKIGVTLERFREVRSALRDASSLDRPIGEDGDATVGDLLADRDAADPEGALALDDIRARIGKLLEPIDERSRAILELRYGFVDGQSRTLEQVARELDLSRERVRQLEKEALRLLREPAEGGLADVLDLFDEAA